MWNTKKGGRMDQAKKNRIWYARVGRMPENRLVKKGMTNKPVGIRSRDRPKKRWYGDLEETNL